LERFVYEVEAIKNNWSVRELERAIDTALYVRTGLSKNKEAVIHADAGQMNVYLNYYKENELSEGDNPPIGLILCRKRRCWRSLYGRNWENKKTYSMQKKKAHNSL
jgi:hypothetical protein